MGYPTIIYLHRESVSLLVERYYSLELLNQSSRSHSCNALGSQSDGELRPDICGP